MILLFDIGNTHTHLGLADRRRVVKQINIPTASWFKGDAGATGFAICRRGPRCKGRRCAASFRAPRRLFAGCSNAAGG